MNNDNHALPRHVGIIMDGNGRWAKKRGLDRFEGHKQGAKVFRKISEYAARLGIEYLTFYAFSTENWKRPPEEVAAIMELFREYLHEGEEDETLRKMRIKFIGDRSVLDPDLIALMNSAEKTTEDIGGTVINLAINYGGRDEIVTAVRGLAEKAKNGEISPEDITAEDIGNGLYTAGQPDPDLIIRPSGEYRLSNFLIWQSAYSEFWFANVLWPDFTEADFDSALEEYARRNRRYGGV